MTFLDYEFTRPDGGNKSQGWALLSVCWALVTAASVTTVLRVFVRTQLTHNMGADDWVMVLCLFTTWLGAGMITTEIIQGGLGRHGYYLQPDQKRHFLAVGWGDWIQTFVTLALMKIAICLFLLRIVDARKIRLVLWGFIGFIVLFTLTFIALFLAICRPIRAYWTVMPEAHCLTDLQIQYITLAQGVLSAITDLILSAFPYFFLRNLHVSRRTKVALVVLMGLGAITAACAIVRTALSGALTHPDITWDVVANVGWRLPEVNLGIACTNAPVLRPLYLYFRGRLDTNRTKKGSTSYPVGYHRGGSSGGGGWGGWGGNRRWKQDSTTLPGSDNNVSVEESVDLVLGPKIGEGGEGRVGSLGTKTAAWA